MQSKGLSRLLSNTTVQKHQFFYAQLSFFLPPQSTSWPWFSSPGACLSSGYWEVICSAFFIVQLSHPYMITGKTIALIRWTFVGKVLSLLFSMLSRLVITFLPRSKHLFISGLQSLSAVILEPPKIKSAIVFTVSPSICNEVLFSEC